jgi:methylmalonyl-CoA mutase N-terminal domain/subunit
LSSIKPRAVCLVGMNLYQQDPADKKEIDRVRIARERKREREREREKKVSAKRERCGLKEADRWRPKFHHMYRPSLP